MTHLPSHLRVVTEPPPSPDANAGSNWKNENLMTKSKWTAAESGWHAAALIRH